MAFICNTLSIIDYIVVCVRAWVCVQHFATSSMLIPSFHFHSIQLMNALKVLLATTTIFMYHFIGCALFSHFKSKWQQQQKIYENWIRKEAEKIFFCSFHPHKKFFATNRVFFAFLIHFLLSKLIMPTAMKAAGCLCERNIFIRIVYNILSDCKMVNNAISASVILNISKLIVIEKWI